MIDERFVFIYKGKSNMEMTREELLDAIEAMITISDYRKKEQDEMELFFDRLGRECTNPND